jgi:hypothetical protein
MELRRIRWADSIARVIEMRNMRYHFGAVCLDGRGRVKKVMGV